MALRMRRLLLGSLPELRHEPHPFHVRASLGGTTVVDSREAELVWEPRRLVPVLADPEYDVHARLVPLARRRRPRRAADRARPGGLRAAHDPRAGLRPRGRRLTLASVAFRPDDPDLGGRRLLIDFGAFDHWLQEDGELVGHPRDPYKRIDTARSSRRVVVSFGGEVLADTTRAVALYETHLPVRWYLPQEDVAIDRFVGSPTHSTCAYKGLASYLSLRDAGPEGHDLAWIYRHPLHDAVPVAGHICFWAERTDLEVDGVAVPRPVTPWSTPQEIEDADPLEQEMG